MAIPSQQIGWSQKSKLLWNIAKQLETLTQVAGNVEVSPATTSSTTTANPNLWVFTAGNISVFPTSSTGYTLYQGGWTSYDDGNATDPVNFAGNLLVGGTTETSFYLSTNGYLYTNAVSFQINGNQQDLYLTPGDSLDDGDTQNFWYQNTVSGSKWKTSILVYCGHCCGSPDQQTPYSYVLNIYKDSQYQYIETVCKTNISGNAGPQGNTELSSVLTQVWQSDANGTTWTYLGLGSVGSGTCPPCPECPTTTTTTTATPGPTPTYTGTIGVTTTPGNDLFRFSMSARNLESTMNVSVNWGDNTSDTYVVGSGSAIYPAHTYATIDAFTVTITVDNPSLINTIIIDHLSAESPAIPTAFNFSDFNGLASIIASNTVLHTADTAGLTTLNSLTINNADLESLALVNASSLQTLSAQNNNLSVLDLTSATVLSYADLHNNQLVGLDIDNATALTYLNLDDNALAQANVDAILLALVANNQTNGTVNLTGVANDAPSSTGLSAKATLEARGWTVTVNTSSSVQSTLMYWVLSNSVDTYQGLTYYDVGSSIYKLLQVYELPRTVYYTGTLGVNTVLWSNPEMTVFNAPQGWNSYAYVGLIFSDVAINRDNVSPSLQTYQIYTYGQNNLIDSNPGTVGTISWNYARFKGSNTISPCDVEWQEMSSWLYYSGTPTLSLGASVAENFSNGWVWYGRYYITQYTGGTSVYQLAWGSNGKEVTNILPCTFTPTFNATWGYTRQDAIDGVNSFSIKPTGYGPYESPTDFTFIGCDGIKLANGNPISQLISGTFWVAYDGLVKQFFINYYEIASYNRYDAPAVDLITPLVTPYQIVVTPGPSYCGGFDSNNTITLYSNFPVITKYTAAYTDAALTTIPSWNWYTMQNNPAGYMYFDKWFYYQPC